LDGKEYLVGTGPRTGGRQRERPTVWRRGQTGWISLEETRETSSTVREQFGLDAPLLPGQRPLRPGQTHDEHVKRALLEGISGLMMAFFRDARW